MDCILGSFRHSISGKGGRRTGNIEFIRIINDTILRKVPTKKHPAEGSAG